MHEIAHDIVLRGAKLERYGSVDIVKIPADKLDEIRALNKLMCDKSDYMPLFNPDMKYVLITKTHFTFAHMLIRDGGRTLYDYRMGSAMVDIKLLPSDSEGRSIQEHGVLLSIYGEELFEEPEAMWSFASQDNLIGQ